MSEALSRILLTSGPGWGSAGTRVGEGDDDDDDDDFDFSH
jgi:hypothetical protein